jgi:hypothetical protein
MDGTLVGLLIAAAVIAVALAEDGAALACFGGAIGAAVWLLP